MAYSEDAVIVVHLRQAGSQGLSRVLRTTRHSARHHSGYAVRGFLHPASPSLVPVLIVPSHSSRPSNRVPTAIWGTRMPSPLGQRSSPTLLRFMVSIDSSVLATIISTITRMHACLPPRLPPFPPDFLRSFRPSLLHLLFSSSFTTLLKTRLSILSARLQLYFSIIFYLVFCFHLCLHFGGILTTT